MADIYIEYLPEIGNPGFDMAAKRLVDLLRTYISEHDTSLATVEAGIQVKSVDIGDWNMDATASVSIAHGLTLANIRSVTVLIKHDSGSPVAVFPFGSSDDEIYLDATNVVLTREAGGPFDGTGYDATSYNRGFITLWYTV